MGWCGWPLEALYGFGLMCFIWSHIHSWNMAWGWLDEESFRSTIAMVGWFMEVPQLVRIFINNMSLFILVISWVWYWLICGWYGCDFLGISVAMMLVMNAYYDNSNVLISLFFYSYINEKYMYGLMDATTANVLRHQFFLAILRWVWDPYAWICCYTCRLHIFYMFEKMSLMDSRGQVKGLFK